MSERLLGDLARRLQQGEDCVLASVTASRGATPRRAGSHMLVSARTTSGSVGGGAAEARVIEHARALLRSTDQSTALSLRLDGGPDSVGICGGRMQLLLQRWTPAELGQVEVALHSLQAGLPAALKHPADAATEDLGTTEFVPNPRLLICGAGHCGRALYELAQLLDFELALHDPRPELLTPAAFPQARCWAGAAELIGPALDTGRQRLVVLLNRDFHTDVAQLRALATLPEQRQPHFIGLMGSRRRLATVRAALADTGLDWSGLHAPVGLALGAQTPHEIAVSILAQLVAWRQRAAERARPSFAIKPR